MLAEGHTAKSIAAELSISINAVNERLRDARRKTGAASSRELARTLAAQEIGDKQIGVGANATTPAGPVPADVSGLRRFETKDLAIMSLAIIAVAAAVLLQQTPSARSGSDLPTMSKVTLDGVVARTTDRGKRMLEEGRDRLWADAAQTRLAAIYRSAPASRSIVTCWRTMCEVQSDASTAGADHARALANDPAFINRIVAAGFKSKPTLETELVGERVQVSVYWDRSG